MLNKILNFVDNDIHAWLDNNKKTPVEYKKMLSKLAVAFLCFFFILTCMFIVNYLKAPPKPSYFYMMPDQLALAREKKPFKAIPFKIYQTPSMSRQKIQAWLSKTLTHCMSFNFGNIDDVVENSRGYFTDTGYNYYLQAIIRSKLRENVLKDRLVSNLTVISDPIFTESPKLSGNSLVWPGVETHAIVTYTSASKSLTQKIIITSELVQSPTWKNPQGLEIQSLSTAPDNGHL
jgi:hypothetical protein